MKAFTSKHEGRYSASAELQTLPAPPATPTLLHADCEPAGAIRVWWQRPALAESREMRYLLQSRDAEDGDVPFAELTVPAEDGQVSGGRGGAGMRDGEGRLSVY